MPTNTHDPIELQKLFSALYGKESDAIFRFCFIRVSDREQALDLMQETFVRLWRTLQDGNDMSNARAFLFTVAHHLIIDWYRKKKSVSLESLVGDESFESFEPASENTDQEGLELAAEGRHLVAAITKLNPSCRQAVFLRFVEGLSPPEIGKILGISPNAASVRVNRGLRELRRVMGYENERRQRDFA